MNTGTGHFGKFGKTQPGTGHVGKIGTFLTRSDSELQIFRSDEWIGLLMQSDIEKNDGIKSDLRIRWPKSDFGPELDDSIHRILKPKWHRSFLSTINVTTLLRRARYSTSATYTQKYEQRSRRWTTVRIQLRCGNPVAAPLRSQTIASCRCTRARS